MRLFEIPFLRPRLLTLTVPQTDLPPFIPGTFLSCCFDWVNYIIYNERNVLNIYEDKFINYGVKFAIYGDFYQYTSKPLKDFMYKSNRGKDIYFQPSVSRAVDKLLIF
ncbi:DUF4180 domain-containing protein [Faecalicatena orotica]|uniref:DUF4180 domain-containing protein n=1 Tax=Clostridia TaxID=186801 RepID=UPI002FE6E68B